MRKMCEMRRFESDICANYEEKRDEMGTIHKNTKCKGTYKKPYRPCPFCGKCMSKLRIHLEMKHKKEPEVEAALLLKTHQKNLAFDALRKQGILNFNMNIMAKKYASTQEIQCERNQKKKKSDLIYCSKCFAFVSKSIFYRHRKFCYLTDNSSTVPNKIQPSIHKGLDEPGVFEKEILASIQNDKIGLLCRSDPLITTYGKCEFKNTCVSVATNKKFMRRNVLKVGMRLLARLYMIFKAKCKAVKVTTESAMDLFNTDNFTTLEESLSQMSLHNDRSTTDRCKLRLGNLLKKVARHIYGSFVETKNQSKAKQITKFLNLLNFRWTSMFGESKYRIGMCRHVFPYTRLSKRNHNTVVWNAVKKCSRLGGCTKAIASTIASTRRRNRIATLYTAQEESADEGEEFLLPLDHKENSEWSVDQSTATVTDMVGADPGLLQSEDMSTKKTRPSTKCPRPDLARDSMDLLHVLPSCTIKTSPSSKYPRREQAQTTDSCTNKTRSKSKRPRPEQAQDSSTHSCSDDDRVTPEILKHKEHNNSAEPASWIKLLGEGVVRISAFEFEFYKFIQKDSSVKVGVLE